MSNFKNGFKKKNSNFFASAIKHQSHSTLEKFRRYTQELESKFKSDINLLDKAFVESIEGLNDNEINEVADYFSDDYFIIEDIHIGLYRRSTLVSIYSFLENSLNHLCKHLWHRENYPVKLNDLKGDGVTRAKNYLDKLAKVDFQSMNSEWSHIQEVNKIRNCIVHCEGNIHIARNTESLEKIINNSKHLSLQNHLNIKVEHEYIDLTLTKVEVFLQKLYTQTLSQ